MLVVFERPINATLSNTRENECFEDLYTMIASRSCFLHSDCCCQRV